MNQLRDGTRTTDAVLTVLDESGLRGLGGAGFPAGRKWRSVRNEPGPRLMAINGDEGEPGTFKDRHYLNSDPHRFLQGMPSGITVQELIDEHCGGMLDGQTFTAYLPGDASGGILPPQRRNCCRPGVVQGDHLAEYVRMLGFEWRLRNAMDQVPAALDRLGPHSDCRQ